MRTSWTEHLLRWGALGFGLLALIQTADVRAQALSAARVRDLDHLVRQDCGSCHGMRLTGGIGPALTPKALAERPRESLIATVLNGRPGTPMPPWSPFVSPEEAAWIIDQLLKGFPEHIADAR